MIINLNRQLYLFIHPTALIISSWYLSFLIIAKSLFALQIILFQIVSKDLHNRFGACQVKTYKYIDCSERDDDNDEPHNSYYPTTQCLYKKMR